MQTEYGYSKWYRFSVTPYYTGYYEVLGMNTGETMFVLFVPGYWQWENLKEHGHYMWRGLAEPHERLRIWDPD